MQLSWKQWLAMALLADLGIALSYTLARLGEPSSVALWGLVRKACS